MLLLEGIVLGILFMVSATAFYPWWDVRISPESQLAAFGAVEAREKQTAEKFSVGSPVFLPSGDFPVLYTCDRDSVRPEQNPPLEIQGIPQGTAFLAVRLDDLDAPGGPWNLWLRWNIPVTGSELRLPEGVTPYGVPGKGVAGNLTYLGPCPEFGRHRYRFTVYALDGLISIPAGSDVRRFERATAGHVVGTAMLDAFYTRQPRPF